MEWLFVSVAMALDTLPSEGRLLLLAALLTVALFGFSRLLPGDATSSVHVLYGKGALGALLAVPLLVYVLGLKLPVLVPPSEFREYNTQIPGLVVIALLCVWLLGALTQFLRLYRQMRDVVKACASGDSLPDKLQRRVHHWCQRLAIKSDVRVICSGSELAWHTHDGKPVMHIPNAARNWPMGQFDVLVLQQLAQIKQNAWRWLLFGRVVQAIFWPMPWVARMVDAFARALVPPSIRLARSAYRDPEGWSRDVRNYNKRADTLQRIDSESGALRLETSINLMPAKVTAPRVTLSQTEIRPDDSEDEFEHRWAGTKARREERHRDPYEQAYWLIASACIAVGIATTLTLVPASPEFEPRFLEIKWHEQMSRRLFDNDGTRTRQATGGADAIVNRATAEGGAAEAGDGEGGEAP